MTREIPLTQGQVALVDDEDYEELNKFRWRAKNARGVFYVVRTPSRKAENRNHIHMHRVIWERRNGPILPGIQIDHVNGNGLDNRLKNLRLATASQNRMNYHATKIGCTSKFKGVRHKNGCWEARINQDQIGSFKTELEAAIEYDKEAKRRFGEFASLNFPDETLEIEKDEEQQR